PAMLFLKRPISDCTDAIAGKPPPTGYAFSQSLSFCPPFCAPCGLVYNERQQSGDELLTTAMLPWLS
ncbi:hypothetical protein, partial [Pseudomonas viridiflava]